MQTMENWVEKRGAADLNPSDGGSRREEAPNDMGEEGKKKMSEPPDVGCHGSKVMTVSDAGTRRNKPGPSINKI